MRVLLLSLLLLDAAVDAVMPVCKQSAVEKHVAALAKQNGVKTIWIIDEAVFPKQTRSEMINQTQRQAFLSTVGKAAQECQIDGVDADYEGWDNPLRKASLNAAQGQSAEVKTVSACLQNYNLVSWVNPKTFKGDWVSLMTYGGGIYDNVTADFYRQQGETAMAAGLNKTLINIGAGIYSSGGEWCQASAACPANLDPAARFCGYNKTNPCPNRGKWPVGPHLGPDGGCPIPLGGKQGAMALGKMIREEGYGAFIWEVNYDTAANGNSVVEWLGKGMRGD